jgi:hypothetical protein
VHVVVDEVVNVVVDFDGNGDGDEPRERDHRQPCSTAVREV